MKIKDLQVERKMAAKAFREGFREGLGEGFAKGFQEALGNGSDEETQDLRSLRTMPYSEYLMTPAWRETRNRALCAVGYSCQICNAHGVELHVHHRTYERRGYEQPFDLIVLCSECHQLFHRHAKIHDE